MTAIITASSPKPMPSTASRSRSRPTTTRSTTSCRKNGDAIASTSSTSDSSSTCVTAPFSPVAVRTSCHALIFSRSSRAANPAAGVSSIATPV